MLVERDSQGWWRILFISGSFVAAVFALVYWDYPFDGMVIEESWNLYTHPKDELGADLEIKAADVWQWLSTRRGGYKLTRLLLVSSGATPVLVNGLCIATQIINLILFAGIVITLAGREKLVPILMAALLYPFASSGHFWQVNLIHHLAVTSFLMALILFLRVVWDQEPNGRTVLFYGIASLGCFWLSLTIMEHAILMPVLLLYLALYQVNGRGTLLKFKRLRSPSTAFALTYLILSMVFVWASIDSVHSRLSFLSPVHVSRFQAWASAANIPPFVMTGLVLGANGILFFSAAAVANSVGYLMYPVLTVLSQASTFDNGVVGWVIGVGAVALLGATGLHLSVRRAASDPVRRTMSSVGFLMTLGGLWVLLAYFPLSLSFAYPRVIGQSADRINALAMFGVALCLGAVAGCALRRLAVMPPVVRLTAFAGIFLAVVMLLGNLRIQRDYWVEAYDKERTFVVDVLALSAKEQATGRLSLIILDRERKPESVRDKLARALRQTDTTAKLLGIAKVVLARHFTEAGELEVTSFHLQGVPLFGGAPSGASYVFDHYSRQLSMPSTLVYKVDNGVTLEEDADHVVIHYERGPDISYSKQDYQPVVLSLDQSFFQFHGLPTYKIRNGSNHIIYNDKP